MVYVAIGLAVIVFIGALARVGVVSRATQVVDTMVSAGRVMTNAELADDVKEKTVRKAALDLLQQFVSILLRSFHALAISTLPIVLLSVTGVFDLGEAAAAAVTWPAIALSLGIAMAAYLFFRPRR